MTIGINPATSRVYIAGDGVEVVDQKTNAILTTISVGGGSLSDIAVDPVRRLAYVFDDSNTVTPGLYVIDLNSNTIVNSLATGAGYPPPKLALNPATNRLYVGLPDGVHVYDASTLSQLALVPYTYSQLAKINVNPVTNRIYVLYNLFPGFMQVIDGKTNTTITTVGGLAELADGMDIDLFRDLIYVSGELGQVSVVNGATNALVTTINNLPGQPEGVSVDAANQKVYVANFALNQVNIINEKTNTLTSATVPVGPGPVNTAIDAVHGLLYVGNSDENSNYVPNGTSVSVIRVH
ncbi:YncE family protein [Acidobacteria bacterium AB60]|nr:YncE family protein [Acidobacteria bacterium AB60]